MLTVPIVFIVLFCLFVPGVAFTQSASAPDSLTLTASPDEILRGGDTSVIIARVTSGGVSVNDYPVTFAVDKSNIAYFPIKNTNVTGSNGETIIILTSADSTIFMHLQIVSLKFSHQIPPNDFHQISDCIPRSNTETVPTHQKRPQTPHQAHQNPILDVDFGRKV
jgi:hypothetical protein